MFKKLLQGLNDVDAYLRNDIPDPDHIPGTPVPWNPDELREPSPWYTSVYWFIRIYSKMLWDLPGNAYDEVRYFIQRGRRGWSDRDVWSLDWYINSWMPDALRHLKGTKHGIPISSFDGLPTVNNDGYTHDDATFKLAELRWDEIMDKMIAGFEACKRMQEGLYEKELGPYPLRFNHQHLNATQWKLFSDKRYKASVELQQRDQQIFEEGMALFAKHYQSLWD